MAEGHDADALDVTIDAAPAAEVTFASGRYTVRRVLGEGGQKIVYLVHDSALERECALGLLKVDVTDLEERSRLSREAQTIARLGAQRHVVTVYDIGDEDGRPFVVSEYVPGGDLRREIRAAGGPLPLPRALAVAIDVSDALALIHAEGVIHRDLKPSNIWLTRDGQAKLGDFGLAYVASDQTQLSIDGTMMGTAAYMPPEQALGQPSDARSDLYSFGCVLYEMMTGQTPFVSDDAVAIVSQHIHTPPVAPSWNNPAIPRALDRLILTLLAKAPDQRPPSATAVRDALRLIASSGADGAVEAANPLDQLSEGVFVGREREVRELRAALESALAGSGKLLLLAGEAGIGKTRMTDELCTYAQLRGARVLIGRCYEGEGAPSYWPWLQALRAYVERQPATALAADMGAGAADIAQLLPELNDRLADLAAPPALDPDQARFRLFDSIATFLKNAARREPLVIVLDDVHWADESSLLMLQFVSRELQGMRVCVISTYRDVELDRRHPLTQTLAALTRDRSTERVLLQGLSSNDVARFVQMTAGLIPTPALVTAVHRETEGNPFFVSEVVRLLVSSGDMERAGKDGAWTPSIPQSVREVVGRRVAHLSGECHRILTVASVIGREFSLNALDRVDDLSEDALLDLLDEALAAKVVVEHSANDGGRFRFSHALVRETLYDEITSTRRVRLHRQIAAALEALYSAAPNEHVAELAYHFFEAGHLDKAVDYARLAGDRAIALLAYEDAVVHYQRALTAAAKRDAPEPMTACELHLALGDAQLKSGDIPAMRASFETAGLLAEQVGAPDQLAKAALGLGSGEDDFIGRDEALFSLLQRALRALGDRDSALKAMVQARLAPLLLDLGHDAEGLAMSQQAIETARAIGDATTLVRALNSRHQAIWLPDALDERFAIATESTLLSATIDDKVAAWYTHDWRFTDLLELGRLDEAAGEVEELLALAEELRQPYWMALSKTTSATLLLVAGRFDEAEAIVEETGAIARRLHASSIEFYSDMQLFALRREQGRLGELDALMERWMVDRKNLGRVARLEAIRHMELDERALAEECFELVAADGFANLPRNNLWLDTLCNLADVCSYLADETRAPQLYAWLAPYEDRCSALGDVVCRGSVARYLGMLATVGKNWQAADAHLRLAMETDSRIGACTSLAHGRYEAARSLFLRGSASDPEQAAQLRDAALLTARELGMAGLATRALSLA